MTLLQLPGLRPKKSTTPKPPKASGKAAADRTICRSTRGVPK